MNWCNVDLGWAYGDLLGSIHRQTRCLDRAYDVLQDALVRLALASSRGVIQQPHAYLRVIVRNILADQGRDLSRWLPFPDDDGAKGAPEHADVTLARQMLLRSVDGEAVSRVHESELGLFR